MTPYSNQVLSSLVVKKLFRKIGPRTIRSRPRRNEKKLSGESLYLSFAVTRLKIKLKEKCKKRFQNFPGFREPLVGYPISFKLVATYAFLNNENRSDRKNSLGSDLTKIPKGRGI